mmetsp:Transcript_116089/g.248308  ORF Transcript_116089/g.248308 Transcript_116089/m.248308 type:complete len:517 (-) Transcript_116089:1279-2829(-)
MRYPAGVHHVDEGVELNVSATRGFQGQVLRWLVAQRFEGISDVGLRHGGSLLVRIVDRDHLGDLLFAVEGHELQVLTKVELAAGVGVHLPHKDVDVVEGRRVAQVPEKIGQLQGADLPRAVVIEAVEDRLHLLHILQPEALPLTLMHHKVEELVEVHFTVWRPGAIYHLREDLVEVLLQRGVAHLLQGHSELLFRNAPALVGVDHNGVLRTFSRIRKIREIDLELLEHSLPDLSRKDEELREPKGLGLATSAHRVGGLLEALSALQRFLELAAKLRDVQSEGLHHGVAELVGRQRFSGPWFLLLTEVVEDATKLDRLAAGEALGVAIDREKSHKLLEVQLAVVVRVNHPQRFLDHAAQRTYVDGNQQLAKLVHRDFTAAVIVELVEVQLELLLLVKHVLVHESDELVEVHVLIDGDFLGQGHDTLLRAHNMTEVSHQSGEVAQRQICAVRHLEAVEGSPHAVEVRVREAVLAAFGLCRKHLIQVREALDGAHVFAQLPHSNRRVGLGDLIGALTWC